MKIAVITDEISQNIDTAASLAAKYNLDAIEIRSVNDRAPHELTEEDVAEIKTAMKKYGLACCGISAPVFKCDLTEENVVAHTEILKKCIKLAHELGTDNIRGFTFFKGAEFSDIVKAIRSIIYILKEEKVNLLLESDPTLNASCGKTLAEVIKAVDDPRVRGLWDPGNDLYSPEGEVPFPDGYGYMRGLVAHVHLKDAVKADGKTEGVAFGSGELDFMGQYNALKEDGYDGYLVMETHYRKKVAISDDLLVHPKGSDFSEGGYDATEECLQNLFKLIGGTNE